MICSMYSLLYSPYSKLNSVGSGDEGSGGKGSGSGGGYPMGFPFDDDGCNDDDNADDNITLPSSLYFENLMHVSFYIYFVGWFSHFLIQECDYRFHIEIFLSQLID
jgi:hypothetical protein